MFNLVRTSHCATPAWDGKPPRWHAWSGLSGSIPTYEPARENRAMIERMTEGKPLVLNLSETEYYRERYEQEKHRRQLPPNP